MLVTPSLYSSAITYKPPSAIELLNAMDPHGKYPMQNQKPSTKGKSSIDPSGLLPKATTFPSRLILPNDDIANDPSQPNQSLHEWLHLPDRNKVTANRNIIYIVPPPTVSPDAKDVFNWPRPKAAKPRAATLWSETQPNPDDILDFLTAFYKPLSVKTLPANLRLTRWSTNPVSQDTYVALECPSLDTSIGIRHRVNPTNTFLRQLNLSDLLDAATDLLPTDAYCLVMLTPFDIYEDDQDDFCCGRACGGSRIAVVSTARYTPILDSAQGVDAAMAWPLSHSRQTIEYILNSAPNASKRKGKAKSAENVVYEPVTSDTPLGAAIREASSRLFIRLPEINQQRAVHTFRVARTTAHELGHCFGLEHCAFYACVMQSTGSMAEDSRQPPYLCAVCAEKVRLATGVATRERVQALKELAKSWMSAEWVALQAWCEGYLKEMEEMEK